jgi:hypothetical protein
MGRTVRTLGRCGRPDGRGRLGTGPVFGTCGFRDGSTLAQSRLIAALMEAPRGRPKTKPRKPPRSRSSYEHHRIVADKGQGLMRLDKFLFDHLAGASRNRIAPRRAGNVLVNGKPQKPSYKVKPDDVITHGAAPGPCARWSWPRGHPAQVLYEDDQILVINKQAGLVVHPGHGNWTGTLVNALLFHFGQLPSAPNQMVPRPGLVHRWTRTPAA